MTALLHAGLNGVAPVMAGVDQDNAWIIRNVLAALVAVAVIALGGLRRRQAPPSQLTGGPASAAPHARARSSSPSRSGP